jgi:hypothetical protein
MARYPSAKEESPMTDAIQSFVRSNGYLEELSGRET